MGSLYVELTYRMNIYMWLQKKIYCIQGNLSITNLKGLKIFLFIAGILLLLGLFLIELTTEGLEIKLFIAKILWWKGRYTKVLVYFVQR